jgi:DNA-binding transcriptional ArsR family regulator
MPLPASVDDRVGATFAALADGGRRRVLDLIAAGPVSVSDVADELRVSVPAALKQVRALEAVALLRTRKDGRTRWCELDPGAAADAEAWLAHRRALWSRRLDRFEQHVTKEKNK